jgi:hypothetical protein
MGGPEDPPYFYDPRNGIRHDENFPDHVPPDWDKPKLDQEIEEWEISIGAREWEQDRRPEIDDANHRDRIRREKNGWRHFGTEEEKSLPVLRLVLAQVLHGARLEREHSSAAHYPSRYS